MIIKNLVFFGDRACKATGMMATVTMLAPKKAVASKKKRQKKSEGKNLLLLTERFSVFFFILISPPGEILRKFSKFSSGRVGFQQYFEVEYQSGEINTIAMLLLL